MTRISEGNPNIQTLTGLALNPEFLIKHNSLYDGIDNIPIEKFRSVVESGDIFRDIQANEKYYFFDISIRIIEEVDRLFRHSHPLTDPYGRSWVHLKKVGPLFIDLIDHLDRITRGLACGNDLELRQAREALKNCDEDAVGHFKSIDLVVDWFNVHAPTPP